MVVLIVAMTAWSAILWKDAKSATRDMLWCIKTGVWPVRPVPPDVLSVNRQSITSINHHMSSVWSASMAIN